MKNIPIGPYSPSVFVDKFLFISGQIGINTQSSKIFSIEDEINVIMKNIRFLLFDKKMDFKNIIKTSIYITDMKNFDKINKIYLKFFKEKPFPARETIQVSGLPKNANIEISAIAYKK